uniref:Uncharacterized protein n=1 Tax=Candidatus Kentrum sp. TC TaxID=2126339 RepID=A0A450ZAR3_9GAMM|nr:MAG: hypothetical protein BECKTC1821D_GA0114238_11232 [Candidatus Kentron sp. TC]
MKELDDFHNAVLDGVRAHFDGKLKTVTMYDMGNTEPIETQAALLVMESGGRGEDLGDGRFPLRCLITLHCILGFKTEKLALKLRKFATSVIRLVDQNRWGMIDAVDLPDIGQDAIGPGEFRPGQEGYDRWYATWEQTVYLGKGVWDPEGVAPEKIYLGQTPAIGAGHEPDYERIDG